MFKMNEAHILCRDDNGTKLTNNGFESYAWRMNEQVLKEAIKNGLNVFFHNLWKDDPYRGGKVIDYKLVPDLEKPGHTRKVLICENIDPNNTQHKHINPAPRGSELKYFFNEKNIK